MDLFLYDRDIRHERVKAKKIWRFYINFALVIMNKALTFGIQKNLERTS